jgi:DNA polymerase/3'-5' exonuclease PolX
MTNDEIAARLLVEARRLSASRENLFRVRAYRRAALAVQGLPDSAEMRVARDGRRALEAVPGIGSHLAYSFAELVRTGDWRTWVERHAPRRARRKAG